jgi:hypothetical protein
VPAAPRWLAPAPPTSRFPRRFLGLAFIEIDSLGGFFRAPQRIGFLLGWRLLRRRFGFRAGAFRRGLVFSDLRPQLLKLTPKRGGRIFGFRRRNETAGLEVGLFPKTLVEPDRKLTGDLEGRQSLAVIPDIPMGCLISGDADLMKQIHRLGRHGSLNFQPTEKIRLAHPER